MTYPEIARESDRLAARYILTTSGGAGSRYPNTVSATGRLTDNVYRGIRTVARWSSAGSNIRWKRYTGGGQAPTVRRTFGRPYRIRPAAIRKCFAVRDDRKRKDASVLSTRNTGAHAPILIRPLTSVPRRITRASYRTPNRKRRTDDYLTRAVNVSPARARCVFSSVRRDNSV